MSTLSDLIDRARTHCRDDGGAFITDEDFTGWANEGQIDIAARTEVLQREATGITATNAISFPIGTDPELVDILTLRLGTDDVEFISSEDWNAWSDDALTPPHTLGRVFDSTIELYPTPDVGTAFTLRYAQLPATLVDGADQTSLPQQMERKLVAYMVAQAKFKDDDYSAGNNWLALYEEGLPMPSIGRELLFTGTLQLSREPNRWDRQSGASHV